VAKFKVGDLVHVRNRFEPELLSMRNATIIGGPNRIAWSNYPASVAGVAMKLYTVRPFGGGFALVIEQHRLVITYSTIFCPSCGEEDYCLEDDYLCGGCRFLEWDGPLT
jgi:hypothetical protein